jgi:hypothetical protein
MSSFAAASTIPVTNKVAHAKNRTSFRILAITAPLHTPPPMHRRPARAAADTMGIPPTLRTTPDASDWFLRPTFFSLRMFSFCSCALICGRSAIPNLLNVRRPISCQDKVRDGQGRKEAEMVRRNYAPSNSEPRSHEAARRGEGEEKKRAQARHDSQSRERHQQIGRLSWWPRPPGQPVPRHGPRQSLPGLILSASTTRRRPGP